MPNCLGLENSFGILYDSVGALVQELEKKVYYLSNCKFHDFDGICLLTLYITLPFFMLTWLFFALIDLVNNGSPPLPPTRDAERKSSIFFVKIFSLFTTFCKYYVSKYVYSRLYMPNRKQQLKLTSNRR